MGPGALAEATLVAGPLRAGRALWGLGTASLWVADWGAGRPFSTSGTWSFLFLRTTRSERRGPGSGDVEDVAAPSQPGFLEAPWPGPCTLCGKAEHTGEAAAWGSGPVFWASVFRALGVGGTSPAGQDGARCTPRMQGPHPMCRRHKDTTATMHTFPFPCCSQSSPGAGRACGLTPVLGRAGTRVPEGEGPLASRTWPFSSLRGRRLPKGTDGDPGCPLLPRRPQKCPLRLPRFRGGCELPRSRGTF